MNGKKCQGNPLLKEINMCNIYKLIVIFLLGLSLQVSAQNVAQLKHQLELQKIFNTALENSPSLQIAKAKLQAMQSQQLQTESLQGWDVHLKSELSYSAMKAAQFPRTANQLTGTYPLYQPDINHLATADNLALIAAKLQLENSRQQLFNDVAQIIFQYRIKQMKIEFLEQERRSLTDILQQEKRRLGLGQQELSKITELEANLATNQVNLLTILEKKWQLQISLSVIVGKSILLTNFKIKQPPKLNKENITNKVLAHPKLQQLVMLKKSASKKVNYQQDKEGLKIDAFISAVYNDSDGKFFDDMQGMRGGVKLEIPLYIGGRTDASTAQARAELNEINAKYKQQKLSLLASAKISHLIYNSNLARINALRSSIDHYQQMIAAVENGITSGSQDSLDLLKAERLLHKAQKEVKITQIKAWQNWYKYHWSVGTL